MKLGFIGCGNMATAIAQGVLKNGLFSHTEMCATDISTDAQQAFEQKTNIKTTVDTALVLSSDFVILAIKPQQFSAFLTQYASVIRPETTLISIAAGKKLDWIQSFFSHPQPLVRVMPNLNATISQATTAFTHNAIVSEAQVNTAQAIISSFGSVYPLEESQFSTFTAIAGSSPAYFFQIIDAMAQSASQQGIDYTTAKQIIIDTMIGSASFTKTTQTPLPELIKNVTSPKGTTEAALNVLNAEHLNETLDKAQIACIQRDIELGQE